ncbi:MAG: sn-glycerol-3-phosphate ABC transporter ATP-binding protein UgpC [Aquisalimonadaceae bacterium]
MAKVEFRKLSKSFDRTELVKGLDLCIEDGEFAVFVGPSGCGKSTLLRLIAGLETITSGEMLIGDQLVNDLPPAKRGVAMVFQSYALYPHMTVYENLAFGMKKPAGGRAELRRRVQDVATTLQLDSLMDRLPRQLSGGQRQRVAIGRSILREPRVFLLDEPLSNLDAALRVQMRMELARLHQEIGNTMIYVTHDQVEAMTLADRIVVLNEGRIEQAGAPLELYHHPANLFVARFIGSPNMNILPAKVVSVESAGVSVQLEDGSRLVAAVDGRGLQAGEPVHLGIRPEMISLRPADAREAHLSCQVLATEALGESTLVHVTGPAIQEPMSARLDGVHRLAGKTAVRLQLPPQACHLFDSSGYSRRRQVA